MLTHLVCFHHGKKKPGTEQAYPYPTLRGDRRDLRPPPLGWGWGRWAETLALHLPSTLAPASFVNLGN